jgi:hypothetical protein
MNWLATIIGTALLSWVGLLLLIRIARRDANQRSLIPLSVRCGFAISFLTWTAFFAAGPNGGVAIGALPTIYLLLWVIISSRVVDFSELAILAIQPVLFAVVFIRISRTQTLAGHPSVATLPKLRLWREVFCITVICLLPYVLRWLYWYE